MPDFQIGVDFDDLVVLPMPFDTKPQQDPIGGSHGAAMGTRSLDLVSQKWTVTWTWQNIHDDAFVILQAWAQRVYGDGPFAVSDPTMDAGAAKIMNIMSFVPNPQQLDCWSPVMVLDEV